MSPIFCLFIFTELVSCFREVEADFLKHIQVALSCTKATVYTGQYSEIICKLWGKEMHGILISNWMFDLSGILHSTHKTVHHDLQYVQILSKHLTFNSSYDVHCMQAYHIMLHYSTLYVNLPKQCWLLPQLFCRPVPGSSPYLPHRLFRISHSIRLRRVNSMNAAFQSILMGKV